MIQQQWQLANLFELSKDGNIIPKGPRTLCHPVRILDHRYIHRGYMHCGFMHHRYLQIKEEDKEVNFAWVKRLERPKGEKDKVQQVRRAIS